METPTQHHAVTADSPIFSIPELGRRTSRLLYESGIKTVAHFLSVPDILLEGTFGPSVPALKKRLAETLKSSVLQSRQAFLERILTFF